jgi:hypothetical protein
MHLPESNTSTAASNLPLVMQVSCIPSDVRRSLTRRLQDLSIPWHKSQSGQLWIEIDSWNTPIQVRSILHQLLTPRSQLANWLEQCCWQIEP